MIVKVQRAITPHDGPILIYNQSRTFLTTQPLTSDWLELMGADLKAFFEIEVHDGVIVVSKKIEMQKW